MSDLALIETERLVLSGWRADQLDDLVRLHGDPEVARYLSTNGAPWTREECEARLQVWIAQFASERMGKLRATRKSDNVLVGRAGYGIFAATGEPEIGFALFREFHGMGYATEAASALRDWLFRDTAWDHFIGFAHVDNAPSIAVLKRIGMVEIGVEDFHGMDCLVHRLEKPA
ncbi:MAG: GNAT family N-acetyltransferase [Devosia sp.]